MDKGLLVIIKNIVHAETIENLNKALKDCLNILESKNVDKRQFINVLNQNLFNISGVHKVDALLSNGTEKLNKVYIFDHKEAPVVYASHYLIAVNKITAYKARLRKLIAFFDNEFEKPKTAELNIKQVYGVLNFLQERYKIFDIITCKVDLEIFLFKNSHKEFNSICEVIYDANEPNKYYNRYILVFASRAEEHDPYQVLIHEIGHALQVALTHDSMMVPESFIEMNKVLKVYLENNTIITADIFADIFSVVAMNKSYLMGHNLLITHFPTKVLNLFEFYFDKLLKFAFDNRKVLKYSELDIHWEL